MDEQRVKELMRAAGLADSFDWVCRYLSEVVNERRVYLDIDNLDALMTGVVNGIRDEVDNNRKPGKQFIQTQLIDYLGGYGDIDCNRSVLDAISAFPHPPQVSDEEEALRRLQFLRAQYAADILALPGLRSPTKSLRGDRLANAAESMEGWFQWVKAGPDPVRRTPKEKWVEDDVVRENNFARWLNRGSAVPPPPEPLIKGQPKEKRVFGPPDRSSHMNCWEAVFFSAYQAGLVTVQRLRLIHASATAAHLAQHVTPKQEREGVIYVPATEVPGANYFDRITAALGLPKAVNVVKKIGLIPSRGDIIFINDDHHVVICLGTTLNGCKLRIQVMSLWSSPTNHFCKTDTTAFGNLSKLLKFVPCPF